MTSLASVLLAHLRHAIECYGPDLPLPLPRPAPPSSPPREPTLPRAAAVGSPTRGAAPESRAAPRPPVDASASAYVRATAADVSATAAVGPAPDPERLAELRNEVLACTRCKLAQGRTSVVFGEGDPRAQVMFIGEAPGFHEDRQGRPFVGPAGQLLDKIIANAMGLRREQVFIANVNKCRPPNNREPEPDEVAACLPYLHEQVRCIRPQVIVTLGRVATQNLLGVTLSIGALRGRELAFDGIPVVATWHPAYLLRNPAAKAETWVDIKRVNRLLGRPEVPPQSAANQEASP